MLIMRCVTKLLWEEGTITYRNLSRTWRNEERGFELASRVYPELNLNSIDETCAIRSLISLYVDAYGPVSIFDIMWWTGLGRLAVVQAIEALSPTLCTVSVVGMGNDLLMSHSALAQAQAMVGQSPQWTRLLAHEDPSLKGYKETRHRYVSPRDYDRLFNSIGEARASVVQDGKVVGLWSVDDQSGEVDVDLFEPRHVSLVGLDAQRERLKAFWRIREH
jgi:hypothetical protein